MPAICDHSGRAARQIDGWPNLVPRGPNGKLDPRVPEASRYVDAVNFATRCRVEAILSDGFVDTACQPLSCYAAFNALLEKKEMLNEPLMNHAAPPHIQRVFFARVLDHVERRTAN